MGTRYRQETEGEWIQPVRRGYKVCCCSCGFVHRLDFRIYRGRIQYRAFLAPRSTAMKRRWRKAREATEGEEGRAIPLKKGYSKSTIGHNISEMTKAGRPRKQAVAAALDTARRAAKAAGKPSKAPKRKRKGK
jgi:hypothetical protein